MKLGTESPAIMKERSLEGFGDRLARIRRARGITQAQLAKAVGVSRRVVAYYEADDAQPPGAILVDLARTLAVSADQLLGLKPVRRTAPPKSRKLLKRLEKVEALPRGDQKAVFEYIEFLRSRRAEKKNGS